jgi:hypothetical protein
MRTSRHKKCYSLAIIKKFLIITLLEFDIFVLFIKKYIKQMIIPLRGGFNYFFSTVLKQNAQTE